MIINTITQIRDKTTNATQEQIEFEGWKENKSENKSENRKRIIKAILNK